MVAYHIQLHSTKILFCATLAMCARGVPSLWCLTSGIRVTQSDAQNAKCQVQMTFI